jgi:hypothetical protein
LHCHGDQRRFKALAGVQRAIFEELEICYSNARFGGFLESVLSDPTHSSHEATSAWWSDGADPFNDRVTDLFKRIPLPDVKRPTLWTAEDRQHLVPRAHQDERLLEYMQRQRAIASADSLTVGLESLDLPEHSSRRRRL